MNAISGLGILSKVLDVASMFFPPLALASSVAKMVTQAVGEAVKGVVDQLSQQGGKNGGMPKFQASDIKKMVDEIVKALQQAQGGESTQASDQAAQDNFKSDMQQLIQDLIKSMMDAAKALMDLDKGDGKKKATSAGGTGGKTTGASGGSGSNGASGGTNGASAADGTGGSDSGGGMSWLEAIAASMGEAAGKKAAKMVELSNQLNSMKPAAEGDTAGQQQQALEMNKINSQFQAVSQEFNMLQTAFSNAIKSIGEGLVKMSGKQ